MELAKFGPNEFNNPTGKQEKKDWEAARARADFYSHERISRLMLCARLGLTPPADVLPEPRQEYFTDRPQRPA